jgi:hypothetical protein
VLRVECLKHELLLKSPRFLESEGSRRSLTGSPRPCRARGSRGDGRAVEVGEGLTASDGLIHQEADNHVGVAGRARDRTHAARGLQLDKATALVGVLSVAAELQLGLESAGGSPLHRIAPSAETKCRKM